uniref:Uncharacterized protein n=1 Tax=Chromera velia CCMP2878 TaxID=1169474 RepID=A0A0G4H170_9ALVE|eukprot:Cvel_823.t1-p1 / transcript=Cvel_823.t1 / gene=Cvel_823 / organism=Chromera_velia_CCMP2878 / gene_product=hypothetical protein / transcript_product=hypothetical protein / location=Cvel_scaffold25:148776-166999(-) / protein_length=4108 / sequence_SO=supercontig / SO=protein_coding / is_pseudo=false
MLKNVGKLVGRGGGKKDKDKEEASTTRGAGAASSTSRQDVGESLDETQALRGMIDELVTKNAELEKEKEQLQKQRAATPSSSSGADETKLRHQLEEARSEIERLSASEAILKEVMQEAEAAKKKAEAEQQKAEEALGSAIGEKSTLQMQMMNMENEMGDRERRAAQKEAQAEKDLAAAKEMQKGLEEEKEALKKQADNLSEQLKEEREEMAKLQTALAAAEAAKASLAATSGNSTDRLNELQEEVDRLKRDKEVLEAREKQQEELAKAKENEPVVPSDREIELEVEVDGLKDRLQDAEKDLQAEKQRVVQVEETARNEREALQKSLQQAEAEKESLQTEMAAASAAAAAAAAPVVDVGAEREREKEKEKLREELERERQESSMKDKQIEELERQVENETSRSEQLQRERDEAKDERVREQGDFLTKEQDLLERLAAAEALAAASAAGSSAVEDVQEELEKERATVRRLEVDLQAERSGALVLQEELREKEKELSEAQAGAKSSIEMKEREKELEKEISDLRLKAKEAEEAAEASEEKLKLAEEKVETQERESQETAQKVITLTASVGTLETKLAALERERDQLQQKADDAASTADQLRDLKEKEEEGKSAEEMEAKIKELSKEITTLEESLEATKEELSDAKLELTLAESSRLEQDELHKAHIRDLQENLDEMKRKMAQQKEEFEEQVETEKIAAVALLTELEGLKSELSTVQTAAESAEKEKAHLEEKLKEIKREEEAASGEANRQRTEAERLAAQIAVMQAAEASRGASDEERMAEAARQEEQIQALEKEAAEERTKGQAAQTVLEELRSSVSQKDDQISSLKDEVAEKEKEASALRQAAADDSAELASLRAAVSGAAAEQAALAEKEREASVSAQKAAAAERERATLEKEVSKLSAEKNELQKRLDESEAESQQLLVAKMELQELRAEMDAQKGRRTSEGGDSAAPRSPSGLPPLPPPSVDKEKEKEDDKKKKKKEKEKEKKDKGGRGFLGFGRRRDKDGSKAGSSDRDSSPATGSVDRDGGGDSGSDGEGASERASGAGSPARVAPVAVAGSAAALSSSPSGGGKQRETELEEQIERLSLQFHQEQAKREELEKQLAESNSHIAVLEKDGGTSKGTVSEDEYKEKCRALEAAEAKLESERKALESLELALAATVPREAHEAAIREQEEAAEVEREKLDSRLKELEVEVEGKEKEVRRLEGEVAEKEREGKAKEAELEEKRKKVQDLEAKVEEKEKEAAAAREKAAAAAVVPLAALAVDSGDSEAVQRERERADRLKEDLAASEERSRDLQKEMDSLREENAQLLQDKLDLQELRAGMDARRPSQTTQQAGDRDETGAGAALAGAVVASGLPPPHPKQEEAEDDKKKKDKKGKKDKDKDKKDKKGSRRGFLGFGGRRDKDKDSKGSSERDDSPATGSIAGGTERESQDQTDSEGEEQTAKSARSPSVIAPSTSAAGATVLASGAAADARDRERALQQEEEMERLNLALCQEQTRREDVEKQLASSEAEVAALRATPGSPDADRKLREELAAASAALIARQSELEKEQRAVAELHEALALSIPREAHSEALKEADERGETKAREASEAAEMKTAEAKAESAKLQEELAALQGELQEKAEELDATVDKAASALSDSLRARQEAQADRDLASRLEVEMASVRQQMRRVEMDAEEQQRKSREFREQVEGERRQLLSAKSVAEAERTTALEDLKKVTSEMDTVSSDLERSQERLGRLEVEVVPLRKKSKAVSAFLKRASGLSEAVSQLSKQHRQIAATTRKDLERTRRDMSDLVFERLTAERHRWDHPDLDGLVVAEMQRRLADEREKTRKKEAAELRTDDGESLKLYTAAAALAETQREPAGSAWPSAAPEEDGGGAGGLRDRVERLRLQVDLQGRSREVEAAEAGVGETDGQAERAEPGFSTSVFGYAPGGSAGGRRGSRQGQGSSPSPSRSRERQREREGSPSSLGGSPSAVVPPGEGGDGRTRHSGGKSGRGRSGEMGADRKGESGERGVWTESVDQSDGGRRGSREAGRRGESGGGSGKGRGGCDTDPTSNVSPSRLLGGTETRGGRSISPGRGDLHDGGDECFMHGDDDLMRRVPKDASPTRGGGQSPSSPAMSLSVRIRDDLTGMDEHLFASASLNDARPLDVTVRSPSSAANQADMGGLEVTSTGGAQISLQPSRRTEGGERRGGERDSGAANRLLAEIRDIIDLSCAYDQRIEQIVAGTEKKLAGGVPGSPGLPQKDEGGRAEVLDVQEKEREGGTEIQEHEIITSHSPPRDRSQYISKEQHEKVPYSLASVSTRGGITHSGSVPPVPRSYALSQSRTAEIFSHDSHAPSPSAVHEGQPFPSLHLESALPVHAHPPMSHASPYSTVIPGSPARVVAPFAGSSPSRDSRGEGGSVGRGRPRQTASPGGYADIAARRSRGGGSVRSPFNPLRQAGGAPGRPPVSSGHREDPAAADKLEGECPCPLHDHPFVRQGNEGSAAERPRSPPVFVSPPQSNRTSPSPRWESPGKATSSAQAQSALKEETRAALSLHEGGILSPEDVRECRERTRGVLLGGPLGEGVEYLEAPQQGGGARGTLPVIEEADWEATGGGQQVGEMAVERGKGKQSSSPAPRRDDDRAEKERGGLKGGSGKGKHPKGSSGLSGGCRGGKKKGGVAENEDDSDEEDPHGAAMASGGRKGAKGLGGGGRGNTGQQGEIGDGNLVEQEAGGGVSREDEAVLLVKALVKQLWSSRVTSEGPLGLSDEDLDGKGGRERGEESSEESEDESEGSEGEEGGKKAREGASRKGEGKQAGGTVAHRSGDPGDEHDDENESSEDEEEESDGGETGNLLNGPPAQRDPGGRKSKHNVWGGTDDGSVHDVWAGTDQTSKDSDEEEDVNSPMTSALMMQKKKVKKNKKTGGSHRSSRSAAASASHALPSVGVPAELQAARSSLLEPPGPSAQQKKKQSTTTSRPPLSPSRPSAASAQALAGQPTGMQRKSEVVRAFEAILYDLCLSDGVSVGEQAHGTGQPRASRSSLAPSGSPSEVVGVVGEKGRKGLDTSGGTEQETEAGGISRRKSGRKSRAKRGSGAGGGRESLAETAGALEGGASLHSSSAAAAEMESEFNRFIEGLSAAADTAPFELPSSLRRGLEELRRETAGNVQPAGGKETGVGKKGSGVFGGPSRVPFQIPEEAQAASKLACGGDANAVEEDFLRRSASPHRSLVPPKRQETHSAQTQTAGGLFSEPPDALVVAHLEKVVKSLEEEAQENTQKALEAARGLELAEARATQLSSSLQHASRLLEERDLDLQDKGRELLDLKSAQMEAQREIAELKAALDAARTHCERCGERDMEVQRLTLLLRNREVESRALSMALQRDWRQLQSQMDSLKKQQKPKQQQQQQQQETHSSASNQVRKKPQAADQQRGAALRPMTDQSPTQVPAGGGVPSRWSSSVTSPPPPHQRPLGEPVRAKGAGQKNGSSVSVPPCKRCSPSPVPVHAAARQRTERVHIKIACRQSPPPTSALLELSPQTDPSAHEKTGGAKKTTVSRLPAPLIARTEPAVAEGTRLRPRRLLSGSSTEGARGRFETGGDSLTLSPEDSPESPRSIQAEIDRLRQLGFPRGKERERESGESDGSANVQGKDGEGGAYRAGFPSPIRPLRPRTDHIPASSALTSSPPPSGVSPGGAEREVGGEMGVDGDVAIGYHPDVPLPPSSEWTFRDEWQARTITQAQDEKEKERAERASGNAPSLGASVNSRAGTGMGMGMGGPPSGLSQPADGPLEGKGMGALLHRLPPEVRHRFLATSASFDRSFSHREHQQASGPSLQSLEGGGVGVPLVGALLGSSLRGRAGTPARAGPLLTSSAAAAVVNSASWQKRQEEGGERGEVGEVEQESPPPGLAEEWAIEAERTREEGGGYSPPRCTVKLRVPSPRKQNFASSNAPPVSAATATVSVTAQSRPASPNREKEHLLDTEAVGVEGGVGSLPGPSCRPSPSTESPSHSPNTAGRGTGGVKRSPILSEAPPPVSLSAVVTTRPADFPDLGSGEPFVGSSGSAVDGDAVAVGGSPGGVTSKLSRARNEHKAAVLQQQQQQGRGTARSPQRLSVAEQLADAEKRLAALQERAERWD